MFKTIFTAMLFLFVVWAAKEIAQSDDFLTFTDIILAAILYRVMLLEIKD